MPVSDPRLVVVVLINEPQSGLVGGGAVAAPIFARIAQKLVVLYEIPPDDIRFVQSASHQ